MSYDYNAIVASISQARQAAATSTTRETRLASWQEALNGFETLSGNCPMTPLLWIQYGQTAYDFVQLASTNPNNATDTTTNTTAATELCLQTLELGLQEFPGSVLLQIQYCTKVCQAKHLGQDIKQAALTKALDMVGRGSHRNEGSWVGILYTLQAQVGDAEVSFVQRAKCPMKDANDSLTADYQHFCQRRGRSVNSETLARIEDGRRMASKVFRQFEVLEDEIDTTMHSEGILGRYALATPVDGSVPAEWTEQLQRDQRFAMGYGGVATANAFIKYALALQKLVGKRKQRSKQKRDDVDPDQVELEDLFPSLALSVYERGVAECPTIETIWLSYIRCLHDFLHSNVQTPGLAEAAMGQHLQSVVVRAARNCPYSRRLVEQQLHANFTLAQHSLLITDPENLLSIAEKALDTKFLPGEASFLRLYTQAIRTVKRRILHLLSPVKGRGKGSTIRYDEVEGPNDKKQTENLSEEDQDEVTDLIDDLSDMFNTVDERLRKHFPSWTEGRAQLAREQAATQFLLVAPLQTMLDDGKGAPVPKNPAVASFERCTRLHNPAHPNAYLSYIRIFTYASTPKEPVDVARHFRHIRSLYQKAIQSVGESKHTEGSSVGSFDVALSNLCQEWLEFEIFFGSERSLGRAEKAIQKKIEKTSKKSEKTEVTPVQIPANESTESSVSKRKVDDAGNTAEQQSNTKLPRLEEQPRETAMATEDAVPVKENHEEKQEKKIKYHPFTVKVTNLMADTEDMDLVDVFRPKCGKIVHAKIVREKTQHGKGASKGWGLIQFEERESAAKALELSGVIGLKEKLLVVEPSHMPAVTLVPPGMHRVSKTGEGRNSKKNQRKIELKAPPKQETSEAPKELNDVETEKSTMEINDTGKSKGPDLLAFRPRKVVSKADRKRKRLQL